MPEWGDPQTLTDGNLAAWFNDGSLANLGYSGPTYTQTTFGQGDNLEYGPQTISPAFQSWLDQNGYSLGVGTGYGSGAASLYNKAGQEISSKSWGDDALLGGLLNVGIGAFTGGAIGPGFAGSMGIGGAAGGAMNGALAGSIIAGGNDANMAQGAFQGAVGGAVGGSNPAKSMGVTNPIGASAINGGLAGASATAAGGNSLRDIISSGTKNAIGSGVTTGLNQYGGKMGNSLLDQYNSLFGGEQPLSSNPTQNASYPADWQPSGQALYNNITGQESPQMSYTPPSSPAFSGIGGETGYYPPASTSSVPTAQTQQQKQAGLGDLAKLLYGTYNNMQQQKRLNRSISGLENMYSSNGAYAQQLRKQLLAQAAQKGTRANTAGRETQLMAELANRSASLAPSLYQMQNGLGSLQNQQFGNIYTGLKDLGGYQGLRNLFDQFSNQVTGTGGGEFLGE